MNESRKYKGMIMMKRALRKRIILLLFLVLCISAVDGSISAEEFLCPNTRGAVLNFQISEREQINRLISIAKDGTSLFNERKMSLKGGRQAIAEVSLPSKASVGLDNDLVEGQKDAMMDIAAGKADLLADTALRNETINSVDGKESNSSKRIATDLIDVSFYSEIQLGTSGSNWRILAVHRYDKEKTWLGALVYPNVGTLVTVDCAYIRIVMAKIPYADISPDEIAGHFTAVAYTLMGNTIQSVSRELSGARVTSVVTAQKGRMIHQEIKAGTSYMIRNLSSVGEMNISTKAATGTAVIEHLAVGLKSNESVVVKAITDADGFYVFSTHDGAVEIINADLAGGKIAVLDERVSALEINEADIPYVVFEYTHQLEDVSELMGAVDYESTTPVVIQITALFDALATEYADYVSGTDVVEYIADNYQTVTGNAVADVYSKVSEYPKYADGYTTKIYSFVDECKNIGNMDSAPKKTLLLIGGLHGNEDAAPYNLYMLAHELCTCERGNENLFKLRAAYNVYIIPYLNGWGSIHNARCNGNYIDINRNFPVDSWVETGKDKKVAPAAPPDNLSLITYSGEAPMSEFETQVVMAVTDILKPDVAIDYHNYGPSSSGSQFYVVMADQKIGNYGYQAMVDCSLAFIKSLPQYFGTKYRLISGTASPGTYSAARNGQLSRWWGEVGVCAAATCEICNAINSEGGMAVSGGRDLYGAHTFAVGQYTLQSVMLRLCQYAMEKTAAE